MDKTSINIAWLSYNYHCTSGGDLIFADSESTSAFYVHENVNFTQVFWNFNQRNILIGINHET